MLSFRVATAAGDGAPVETPTPDPVPPFVSAVQPWVNLADSAVTTLAVVVGGLWVYWRFVKGRTFKPRIEVVIQGRWLQLGERAFLGVTITMKNIGATRVLLRQDGSGLRVSKFVESDRSDDGLSVAWKEEKPDESSGKRSVKVFENHQWVEPGELISDELLLDVRSTVPVPVRVDTRLVCRVRGPRPDVAMRTRSVVYPSIESQKPTKEVRTSEGSSP